jgi:hypothetical protein
MATIERNSNESDPVHFAWHRIHRARRGGQLIDVVTLAGRAALGGWVMLLISPASFRADVCDASVPQVCHSMR